jgi:hypothetical protein
MQEDKPMILIPYYEVNFNHFLIDEKYGTFLDHKDEVPARMQNRHSFMITSATFNPSASAIAFQNSISVGT